MSQQVSQEQQVKSNLLIRLGGGPWSSLSPSEFASCLEALLLEALLLPDADRSAEIETRNAEIETRMAAKIWEYSFRLRPGTACVGRIRRSAAEISGWTSCNFKR